MGREWSMREIGKKTEMIFVYYIYFFLQKLRKLCKIRKCGLSKGPDCP